MCSASDYYTHGTLVPDKVLKTGLGIHIKESGEERATSYKLPKGKKARIKALRKPGGMPTGLPQVILKLPKGKTLKDVAKPTMIEGATRRGKPAVKKYPLNALVDPKYIVGVRDPKTGVIKKINKKPKVFSGGGGKNAELIRRMTSLAIPKILE